jgi:hypothetical protein
MTNDVSQASCSKILFLKTQVVKTQRSSIFVDCCFSCGIYRVSCGLTFFLLDAVQAGFRLSLFQVVVVYCVGIIMII